MSANGYLIETLTRHQIFLQRFGGGVINDLEPILEKMVQDIRARLLMGPTDFQLQRLQVLLGEIDAIIRDSGGEYGRQLQLKLEEFAEYESGFVSRAMSEVVNVDLNAPAPGQLAAAVTQSAARILQGDVVRQMTVPQLVEQFTKAKRQQVLQTVRAGYIEGAPLQDIVRRVGDITDKATKRQAAAMVRTSVNHMGTTARQETYRANADVISELERVGTLDGRTTFQCMAFDGKRYPIDTSDLPPYHFACRTVMVPVVKDEFSLFKVGNDRAAKGGPVSAKLTYAGWLKRQPKAFQNEVLGDERASLFRSGKVNLTGFVDESGRTLTLDELKRREGLTLNGE